MLIVYWIEPNDLQPRHEVFGDGNNELLKALNICQALRRAKKIAVTSTYHIEDNAVGGIVQDDKLPNGEPYTWKKRR
jgi:hypothetical protein